MTFICGEFKLLCEECHLVLPIFDIGHFFLTVSSELIVSLSVGLMVISIVTFIFMPQRAILVKVGFIKLLIVITFFYC